MYVYIGYLDQYGKKLIWSLVFLLYGSLASCLHDLRLAKEEAFLVLASCFTFAEHISYLITYDLEEQF